MLDAADLEADLRRATAERLRAARVAAGFKTGAAFARHVDRLPVTYRAHEGGQNSLSLYDVLIYARGLGVSPGWLAFGPAGPAVEQEAEAIMRRGADD
jgi:hypothetical protein